MAGKPKFRAIEYDGIMPVSLYAIKLAMSRGYRIDYNGVATAPRGNRLKTVPNKRTGYLEVMLPGPKNSVRVPVHKFQAFIKFGDVCFGGNAVQVRHLDDNKLNNCWDNFALGTAKDNWSDTSPERRSEKNKAGGIAAGKHARERGLLAASKYTPEEHRTRMAKVRAGATL